MAPAGAAAALDRLRDGGRDRRHRLPDEHEADALVSRELEERQRATHQPEERRDDQEQRDEKDREPAQDFHARMLRLVLAGS